MKQNKNQTILSTVQQSRMLCKRLLQALILLTVLFISMPSFALLPGFHCVTGNIIIGGEVVASSTYCYNNLGGGGGGSIPYEGGWYDGGSTTNGQPAYNAFRNISSTYMPPQHQYVSCNTTPAVLRQHAASAVFNAWALQNLKPIARLQPDGRFYLINFSSGGSQVFQWVIPVGSTVTMAPVPNLPCI